MATDSCLTLFEFFLRILLAMIKKQSEYRAKPFLRWAGSKKQLIPVLERYWHSDYRRYVEPFAGSAALFFNLTPSAAVLSDINKELIMTYGQIRNNLDAVLRAMRRMNRGRQHYLVLRAMNPLTMKPEARAARFIYLNRYCFNGLYRTNQAGQFNVPYGGERTGALPDKTHLSECSSRLKVAKLMSCSFETTLENVAPGDFVYMDPPFSVKAQRTFNEYNAASFSDKQLKVLRQWMLKLDRKGIPFLVSYADCDEGGSLSKGFYREVILVRRNIAGFVSSRRRSAEILVSNVQPSCKGEAL